MGPEMYKKADVLFQHVLKEYQASRSTSSAPKRSTSQSSEASKTASFLASVAAMGDTISDSEDAADEPSEYVRYAIKNEKREDDVLKCPLEWWKVGL